MLRGIIPIALVPFDDRGGIDEAALRRIVRFELAGGVHGLGINGFASEAYKLGDQERERTAAIVAEELGGSVPLVIGIAPGSTEAAVEQVRSLARHQPAAFMTLPPATMDNGPEALLTHYQALADNTDVPIMVQQSPHIPGYRHCRLSVERLAELAGRSRGIRYFKIEGPGSAERIRALASQIDHRQVALFGGGGGISFLDELQAGVAGLIPGVGFNEIFLEAWGAWEGRRRDEAEKLIRRYAPLVTAVSGSSHEYSLHARKFLMRRAGYLSSAYVRRPTVPVTPAELDGVAELVDRSALRISLPRPAAGA